MALTCMAMTAGAVSAKEGYPSFGLALDVISLADAQNNLEQDIVTLAEVIEIVCGSSAAEAGILVGDIVVAVNDRQVTDMKIPEFAGYFGVPQTGTIRLVIHRDGEPDFLAELDARMTTDDDPRCGMPAKGDPM